MLTHYGKRTVDTARTLMPLDDGQSQRVTRTIYYCNFKSHLTLSRIIFKLKLNTVDIFLIFVSILIDISYLV